MVAYNLDKIYEIQNAMVEFELPLDVQNILNTLIEKLGINASKPRQPRKERIKTTGDNQWTRKEPFKVSVFEKSEGIDEYIDEMRGIMNKFTKNNYETQYEKLVECIDKIWEIEIEDVTDKIKQTRIIECFTFVVKNNRFYSQVYAMIFSKLTERYIQIDEYRNHFLDIYSEQTEIFSYVDPDQDYDKFCVINKENEQRKSVLSFVIHAVAEDIYSFNIIRDILSKYFATLDLQKKEKEMSYANDEIIENIFVIFSEGKPLIMKEVSKYDLLKQVKEVSGLTTGQNPGITNRIRFKCMDISDLYK